MASTNKTEKFFNNLLLLALVLGLFAVGGYVLTQDIPFWSLFLGIAAIQIGIVLSVFSFDIISRRASKTITEEYKAIQCLVCNDLTYVPKYKKVTICDKCEVRIATAVKPLIAIFVGLVSIGFAINLTQTNQDIRRQAKVTEVEYICEPGNWTPAVCSCGLASQESCKQGEFSRECSDEKIYCCTSDSNDKSSWTCKELQ